MNEKKPTRGFACVGLWRPRDPLNVGAVLRAAGCFDAAMVAIQGRKYHPVRTDTMKAQRHMPLIETEDLLSVVPYDCVPVAIELVDGAVDLPDYSHPRSAFYIFGPEDGSLSPAVLAGCRDVVRVPSGCLNLAAAVNVVLYDRMAKRYQAWGREAA